MSAEAFVDGPFNAALCKLLGRSTVDEELFLTHGNACSRRDWGAFMQNLWHMIGRFPTSEEEAALRVSVDEERKWWGTKKAAEKTQQKLTEAEQTIRLALSEMSANDRYYFMLRLFSGYCRLCGEEEPCYCGSSYDE